MNKSENYTFENIVDVVMANAPEPKKVKWHGIDVEVSPTLSYYDADSFVKNIVDNCISVSQSSDDDAFSPIEFAPEMVDFYTKFFTLYYYTDIPISSDDSTLIYNVIYNSDLYDCIMNEGHINYNQYDELTQSVRERIRNIIRTNESDFNKRLNEVSLKLENVGNTISQIFSDITAEDIAGVVEALAKSGMSEDGIVKAYIDNVLTNTEETESSDKSEEN